jgi:hypothetical protein
MHLQLNIDGVCEITVAAEMQEALCILSACLEP